MASALSPDDEARVVAAIKAAEVDNRGEVRLHLAQRGKGPALAEARRWFFGLRMHRTAADTGVLLYVAVKDREAAVFAGSGLHAAVDDSAWTGVIDAVVAGYRAGRPVDGLCDGLGLIGDTLRGAVPGDPEGNELPDAISRSGGT